MSMFHRGLFCEAMTLGARLPIQIAWVTHDLDAAEAALTGLLGVNNWARMPDVHFTSDTGTYRGEPADFVADIPVSCLGESAGAVLRTTRLGGRGVAQISRADGDAECCQEEEWRQ